jgi:hypothetical protein
MESRQSVVDGPLVVILQRSISCPAEFRSYRIVLPFLCARFIRAEGKLAARWNSSKVNEISRVKPPSNLGESHADHFPERIP